MTRVAIQINDNDEFISWHFGHANRFKIYDIEDGHIISSKIIEVLEPHGMPKLQAMIENNVNVIISDGMGPGVVQAIEEENLDILVYAGIKGNANDVIKAYLENKLISDDSGIHSCGMD